MFFGPYLLLVFFAPLVIIIPMGVIAHTNDIQRRNRLRAAVISMTVMIGIGTAIGLAMLSESLRSSGPRGSLGACTLKPGNNSPIRTIMISTSEREGETGQSTLKLVSRSGFSYHHTVDAIAGTITDYSGGGTSKPLDVNSVAAAMTDAGLDASTESARTQAEQLLALLKTAGDPSQPLFGTPTSSFAGVEVHRVPASADTRVHTIWMWATGPVCIALWFALCVTVIRQWRRVLRKGDSREAAMARDSDASAPSPAGPPPSP